MSPDARAGLVAGVPVPARAWSLPAGLLSPSGRGATPLAALADFRTPPVLVAPGLRSAYNQPTAATPACPSAAPCRLPGICPQTVVPCPDRLRQAPPNRLDCRPACGVTVARQKARSLARAAQVRACDVRASDAGAPGCLLHGRSSSSAGPIGAQAGRGAQRSAKTNRPVPGRHGAAGVRDWLRCDLRLLAGPASSYADADGDDAQQEKQTDVGLRDLEAATAGIV